MDRAGLTLEEATALSQHHGAWWNYTIQLVPNIDGMSTIERHQFDLSVMRRYGRVGIGRLFYEAVALQWHIPTSSATSTTCSQARRLAR